MCSYVEASATECDQKCERSHGARTVGRLHPSCIETAAVFPKRIASYWKPCLAGGPTNPSAPESLDQCYGRPHGPPPTPVRRTPSSTHSVRYDPQRRGRGTGVVTG